MAGADEETATIESTDLPEDACSVADLNAEIEAALQSARDRFPTYVVGEIADTSSYPFGTFFELRDIEAEAKISCIAWSDALEEFDHDLEEGAAAIVRAHVDFYSERGDTQLVVSDYWPLGESDRTTELAELRADLETEGLLDEARKQPLPEYPTRIGVVTSLSGSAREDLTTAVHGRHPGVTVTLCGAIVQGDDAVPSLVGSIQRLEHDPAVDVLVVTRGGGSDTDLWCFNEEPVVRAIADCSTPAVVAVGHEDDETLSEVVADERAMTPTDAGVAVTPNVAEVRQRLAQLEVRVETAYRGVVENQLEAYDRRVDAAFTALQQAAMNRLAALQRAADLEQRVTAAYQGRVDGALSTFERRLEAALRDLEHAVETEAVTASAARGRVGDLEARIDQAYRSRTALETDALESRIENAYRNVEAEARVAAGTAEARRLRVVVAVLLAILLVGAAVIVLLVL